MLPARFAPILQFVLLSGMMSCVVTCVATLRTLGAGPQIFAAWMGAWSLSWPIAFLVLLVVSPLVRRLVGVLVRSET
ncbi:MAG: DUF2798 domain-containing protein [Pseudomonadota bacterium]